MNRAEKRRQMRAAGKALKGKKLPAPLYLANRSAKDIAESTGVKIETITAWTDIQRKEIVDELCKEFNEKLYEAENYISLANVLISVVCLHMTWGYTKACQNFTKNLNAAKEYLQRNGVKKVLEQVNNEYGLDLEFDSFDIEEFIAKCEEAEKEGK